MLKFAWIILLTHLPVFAETLGVRGCGRYNFQGIPKMESEKMILVLHPDSLSELRIDIPKAEEQEFAPYLNLATKGVVEIDRFDDYKTVRAKKFSKLDYGIPNPINPVKHSFISLRESRKCR